MFKFELVWFPNRKISSLSEISLFETRPPEIRSFVEDETTTTMMVVACYDSECMLRAGFGSLVRLRSLGLS